MKPFLGINITENRQNKEKNGREFLVAELSPMMAEACARAEGEMKQFEKQARPMLTKIVYYALVIVSIASMFGILWTVNGTTLAKGFARAPWLYFLLIASWIFRIVISRVSRRMYQTKMESDEGHIASSRSEATLKAAFDELQVPPDASDIDLLSFFYVDKAGKIKPRTKGMQITAFFNIVYKTYTDGEYLYFADLEGKYAFLLSELVAIHTVKKNTPLPKWNKSEDLHSPQYKPYKLNRDDFGRIHCKGRYMLQVNHNGVPYSIAFPAYELPLVEQLTGLKAPAL